MQGFTPVAPTEQQPGDKIGGNIRNKGENKMIIETKRLILRPWCEDDAEELFRYAADPRIGPAAGWKEHESVEESREIIKNVLSADEIYAVVLKSTGLPVGSVGIKTGEQSNLLRSSDEGEIGYWIGVPYWGQGLIPEAVSALQERAFNELGMKLLWCAYYRGNDRSKRVQEKCGFKYHHTVSQVPTSAGDMRTEIVNILTREDWAACK